MGLGFNERGMGGAGAEKGAALMGMIAAAASMGATKVGRGKEKDEVARGLLAGLEEGLRAGIGELDDETIDSVLSIAEQNDNQPSNGGYNFSTFENIILERARVSHPDAKLVPATNGGSGYRIRYRGSQGHDILTTIASALR